MNTVRNIYIGLGLSISALIFPGNVLAEQGTLRQCQTIQNQIERYTNLRRNGGSSGQMSSWQKQRNHFNDQYLQKNCRVHRSQLQR